MIPKLKNLIFKNEKHHCFKILKKAKSSFQNCRYMLITPGKCTDEQPEIKKLTAQSTMQPRQAVFYYHSVFKH